LIRPYIFCLLPDPIFISAESAGNRHFAFCGRLGCKGTPTFLGNGPNGVGILIICNQGLQAAGLPPS
jgi:hypothetical protein